MVVSLLFAITSGFQIGTIQQRPSYKEVGADPEVPGSGTLVPTSPSTPSVVGLHDVYKQSDAPRQLSRYTYLGCFEAADLQAHFVTTAPDNIESAGASGNDDYLSNWGDPNACIKHCKDPTNWIVSEDGQVIEPETIFVAVKQKLCSCLYQSSMDMFSEVPEARCTFRCGPYASPLCGGELVSDSGFQLTTHYYGIFREYDHLSMASQGAYDPWRSIYFSIAVVKESTINNADAYSGGTGTPERYFLHAVNTDTGEALFQFQIPLNTSILYGLQFDLDDSRLACIAISKLTGRVPGLNQNWNYQLATISIDTSIADFPRMTYQAYDLTGVTMPEASKKYLSFIGASAIFSKRGMDTLIFSQLNSNAGGREIDGKDMVYAVSIGDPKAGSVDAGHVYHHEQSDMKILQIMANERDGIVSAFGIERTSRNAFRVLGKIVYGDDIQVKAWQPPSSPYPGGSAGPSVLSVLENTHILPAVCTSEHIGNWSIIAHRPYRSNWNPETDDPIGQAFFKINLVTGALVRYCKSGDIDPDCSTGVVDPQIPYAAVFNREPRIPLSLPAAQMITCEFTKDGTHIIINFDLRTLKGCVPVDTDNDNRPDVVDWNSADCMIMSAGEFNCALVLDEDTVEKCGTSAMCQWADGGSTLIITLANDATIEVGTFMGMKQKTVYTRPSEDADVSFSMPTSHLIAVEPPSGDLSPVIRISAESTITIMDQCSDMFIDAESTSGIGGDGRGIFVWSIIDGEDIKPTTEGGTEIDQQAVEDFLSELEKATLANSMSLQIASEKMPKSYVYPVQLTVISRWGQEYFARQDFFVEKLNFEAPSISVQMNVTNNYYTWQGLRLVATCTPSLCSIGDEVPARAFTWSMISDGAVPDRWGTVEKNLPTLNVPPHMLSRSTTYTLQVICQLVGVSSTAAAQISVDVLRSDIVIGGYFSRKHQHGKPLIMDGSDCYDPDEKFSTGPQLQFKYTYSCFTPTREPCYPNEANSAVLSNLQNCEYDQGDESLSSKLTVGGKAYQTPTFIGQNFCQQSTGVVILNTANWPEPGDEGDAYTLRAHITSQDGRTAEQDVTLHVTRDWVPDVYIGDFAFTNALEDCIRVPTNAVISVVAYVNLDGYVGTPTYTWAVYTKMIAEMSDPNTGEPIQIQNLHPTGIDTTNGDHFVANEGSLQITPYDNLGGNILEMGMVYTLRVTATITVEEGPLQDMTFSGTTDKDFETAFYPASSGTLTVISLTPQKGSDEPDPTQMFFNSRRSIEAPGWKAAQEPIAYKFRAYECANKVCSQFNRVGIGNADKTKKKISVGESCATWLPIGDPNNDYTLLIEVEIQAFCSLPTTKMIEVKSKPLDPDAAEKLFQEKIGNGEASVECLSKLKSLLPEKPSESAVNNLLDALQTNVGGAVTTPTDDEANSVINALQALDMQTQAQSDQALAIMNDVPLTEATAANALVLLGSMLGGVVGDGSQNSAEIFAGGTGASFSSTRGSQGSQAAQGNQAAIFSSQDDLRFVAPSVSDHRGTTPDKRPGVNHGVPKDGRSYVEDCRTDYCDSVGLFCQFSISNIRYNFKCCHMPNVYSMCNEPPCWFPGSQCPGALSSSQRRLERTEPSRPQEDWFRAYMNLTGKNLQYDPIYDTNSEHRKLYEDLRKRKKPPTQDYIPTGLNSSRRLQLNAPEELTAEELINREKDEQGVLVKVREYVVERMRVSEDEMLEESKYEIICHVLAIKDPEDCLLMRMIENDRRNAVKDKKRSFERVKSQFVAQTFALRDRALKVLLQGIKVPNLAPLQFPAGIFQCYIGKRTSLEQLHGKIMFPPSFTTTAPDSYAYSLIEYAVNPYRWSASTPPSTQTLLVTIMIFNGTTLKDITVINEPIPVKIFRDLTVGTSGLCMYWDRFSADSNGGAWSSQGMVNDGAGCMATHLSDIGIFSDGSMPTILDLHEAATYYKPREIDESSISMAYVGVRSAPLKDKTKLNTIAIAFMVLLFNIVLICWGYKHDEKVRENIARGVIPFQTFHFDGDGVTVPLNVNDPIAYKWSHLRNPLFVRTFWNVVKRDHMLIAPYYYHVQFSRPQRLFCALALESGIMGLNAVIHGNPDKLTSREQYIVSGIFSALLMFPLYCCASVLFTSRPSVCRRTLIRRSHPVTELNMLQREHNRLEKNSSLAPIGGPYAALPPPPPMARAQATTLLQLPAPLPATAGNVLRAPPGVPSLPEPPQAPNTSQLALTNNIQPPPPKYPPPPNSGKAAPAILPPIFFTAKTPAPPPLRPLPALQNFGAPPSPTEARMRALPPVPNLEALAQGATHSPIEGAGIGDLAPPKRFEGEHKASNPDSGRAPLPPSPPGQVPSPRAPSLPPPSTRTAAPGGSRAPAGLSPVAIHGPELIATRGQPPPIMMPPFAPAAPPRPPAFPPGMTPGSVPGANGGMPPPPPGFKPPPPPPPREDEAAFVRRIRMVYMDRVTREHQKLDLLAQDSLGKPVPVWMYRLGIFIPYVCCIVIVANSLFYTGVYGVKFDTWQEERWDYACIVGVSMVAFILEMIRMSITTIVELRKFEIRKKCKAGDFEAHRVKRQVKDDSQASAVLRPKQLAPPSKTPLVPKTAPKFGLARPGFLPDAADPTFTPPRPPPAPPEGGLPIIRPPGVGHKPPAPPGGLRTPNAHSPRTPLAKSWPKSPMPAIPMDRPLLPGSPSQGSQASRLSAHLQESLRSRTGGSGSGVAPPPPPSMMTRKPNHSPTGSQASVPPPPSKPPSETSSQRAKFRAQQ